MKAIDAGTVPLPPYVNSVNPSNTPLPPTIQMPPPIPIETSATVSGGPATLQQTAVPRLVVRAWLLLMALLWDWLLASAPCCSPALQRCLLMAPLVECRCGQFLLVGLVVSFWGQLQLRMGTL